VEGATGTERTNEILKGGSGTSPQNGTAYPNMEASTVRRGSYTPAQLAREPREMGGNEVGDLGETMRLDEMEGGVDGQQPGSRGHEGEEVGVGLDPLEEERRRLEHSAFTEALDRLSATEEGMTIAKATISKLNGELTAAKEAAKESGEELARMRKRLGVSKADWDSAMKSDRLGEEVKSLQAQLNNEKMRREALAKKCEELETESRATMKMREKQGELSATMTRMSEELMTSGAGPLRADSKALMEDALLEMEGKVDRLRQEAQDAHDKTVIAETALKNEQKLSTQFRTLLSSLKKAFEEEKMRRIAAETGMPAPAGRSGLGGGGRGPPPSHPNPGGHQKLQSLIKENQSMKSRLKGMDGPVVQQVQERMKSYHVISLEEHQDALREEIKVRNADKLKGEESTRALRAEINKLEMELKESKDGAFAMKAQVGELENKLATIRGHLV